MTSLFIAKVTLLITANTVPQHNLSYVKLDVPHRSRCGQSKHAKKRHRPDRQHISKSSTSLVETPASCRRFFLAAIFR